MIKDSLGYLIARILPSTINILSLIIFTRLFTTEEYGHFAIIVGLGTLFNSVLLEWVKNGFIRFALDDIDNNEKKLFSTVFLIQLIIIVCIFIISLCLYIFGVFGLLHIILINLIIISQSSYSYQLAIYRARFETKKYIITSLKRAVLVVLLTLMFYFFGLGYLSLVLGFIIGHFVSIFQVIKSTRKSIYLKEMDWQYIVSFVKYSLPFIIILSTAVLIYNMDRLMLGYILDLESAGAYAAVTNFGMGTISFVVGSISLATFPHIIKIFNESNHNKLMFALQKTLTMIVLSTMPIIAIFTLYNEFISSILFGTDFQAYSILIMPFIIIASLLEGFKTNYIEIPAKLYKKTKILLIPSLSGVVINFILNYILIKRFEIIGAAYATILTYIIMILLSYFLNRRIMKIKISLFESRKVLWLFLVLIITIITFRLTNFNEWFEIIIIGCVYLLFILYLNLLGVKDSVKKVFNKINK